MTNWSRLDWLIDCQVSDRMDDSLVCTPVPRAGPNSRLLRRQSGLPEPRSDKGHSPAGSSVQCYGFKLYATFDVYLTCLAKLCFTCIYISCLGCVRRVFFLPRLCSTRIWRVYFVFGVYLSCSGCVLLVFDVYLLCLECVFFVFHKYIPIIYIVKTWLNLTWV